MGNSTHYDLPCHHYKRNRKPRLGAFRAMSSIISLRGLNDQQRWLAQQLWICDNLDEVADLRDSIDEDMWHDMYLVMELIFLADIDSYIIDENDCKDANTIINELSRDPYV